MNYVFALLVSISIPFSSINLAKGTIGTPNLTNDSIVYVAVNKPNEMARIQFEDSLTHLYDALGLMKYNLSFEVFRYGMIGYNTVLQQGRLNSKSLITIIDFTKPSSEKRFYILDLEKLQVLYHTYVSHGKNSGENEVKSFSNVIHSNQSSLGFYVTAETYIGSKGYSLKLDGIEKGYNDNMRTRAVVMHEADYVSESWIKKYGRLGRSQGCPALPVGLSREIINVIKHHTLIFAYFDDPLYLQHSPYLNLDQVLTNFNATASIHE